MISSQLPGVNLLLIGPTGSGKTTSLRAWIDGIPADPGKIPIQENSLTGLTVFGLFTEPSFEVLSTIPCRWFHWKYLPPTSPPWADMIDSAKKINLYDLKMLSGLSDINKSKYSGFIDVLQTFHNFKCDRCGESYGDISTWGTNRVIALDSLSGLNIMAMNLVVGSKPVKSMSDWGIAMDNEERLIQKLCVDKRCHFVLTAHAEREIDETTGQSQIMAATLGRKLAPRLPRFFSDVVLAKRTAEKFEWSTTATGVDLKARNLPFADNLPPTAKIILDSWRSRGGLIETPA